MIKFLILILIRFYQKFLSFDTGLGKYFAFNSPVCRHSPSCSQYTYEAVEKYGVFKGLQRGVMRILNCR